MVNRPASVEDIHRIATAMPHVTVTYGSYENAIYQVGGKSFVFFRNPRPDALDLETGERLDDVIVFWVGSDDEKHALLQSGGPYFTTPHFDGHRSVLIRQIDIPKLNVEELTELIQDAWLVQASRRRANAWLATKGLNF
jgi:hypothetical protein